MSLQYQPAITELADGRFVVSFTDFSSKVGDTSQGAIRAQIFDPREAAVVLAGTAGQDDLIGTRYDDTILGDTGDDNLAGGAGDDILNGEDDNDTLRGNGGEDTLSGGDGNDRLLAGKDNDDLSGGAGNDFLNGGRGVDTMTGAPGMMSMLLTVRMIPWSNWQAKAPTGSGLRKSAWISLTMPMSKI